MISLAFELKVCARLSSSVQSTTFNICMDLAGNLFVYKFVYIIFKLCSQLRICFVMLFGNGISGDTVTDTVIVFNLLPKLTV